MIGRVAVWLLIAFVLFTVFRQFDNSATAPMNAEQTSYTQFMQDAKDGKIRRVDVQGRKITVTPVEGASYVITSPGDLWMVDDLRKNGVQVFGKPEEEPSLRRTVVFADNSCELVPDAAFDRRVDFLHASNAGRQVGRLFVRQEQGAHA